MIIRLLTTDDVAQYRALRLKALQTNPESYLSTYESEKNKPLDSFAWELRYATSQPVNGYYGVFIDDQLVGYTQLERSYLAKQQHIAYLYSLYVDPAYRGKGHASKLLTYLGQLAKEKAGIERLFITCNRKNLPAQELYKKLGFKQYSIREKSVKWGNEYDDEIEMVKEL
ncbi:MAG: acetyltransferase, GNAT family protein [Candidatus Pacebacteria bacterium GW2011_GWB1_47_8]|nr:MAG: acetyltransferase, GNAT family protein [Candidatus Pacebacteria bacterium GW2011_GWA1_46_10]KKU84703.1 MAG: acetyltransferase, GNAT family protein [Candidatus Pacebacteria bacterium GW2011_GWB1_47_8]HCR81015.1 GNAT family N-acetyltransferase [Candidatus Paceibacterota bacterium]